MSRNHAAQQPDQHEQAMPKQVESKPAPTASESRAVDKEAERQERQNRQTLAQQRKVRILIPSGHDEQGRCPVTVGVNGYAYLIERDKEVLVPEGVVNVLKLAKESTAVRIEENGQIRVDFRESPRYPMQILGYEEA